MSMSIRESMMLQELTRLVHDLAERVRALEQRSPSRDPWPTDIIERLVQLEAAAIAVGNAPIVVGNASDAVKEQRHVSGNLADITQRLEVLEARHEPAGLHSTDAQRIAAGAALRAAIAGVLQSDPAATGPRVIEALRTSHAGKLPSLRTVRWHLQALRGNGKSAVLP